MKAPKKRNIPKAKRSQHLKRRASIAQELDMLPIMRIASKTTQEVLATPVDLEMEYSIEQSHKIMGDFLASNGLAHSPDVFIPESVVCKAHNYGELIIGLKMKQVYCTDWHIEVVGTFYNTKTEQFKDVLYKKTLNGVSYIEVFMGMPIKIDRGNGIKTRWQGLEKELKDHFDSKGFTSDAKWYRGNTNAKFIGKCFFNDIESYEEFKHLQKILNDGDIEAFFEAADQDAIKTGRVDEKMQPKNKNLTSMPTNLLAHFKKQYPNLDFSKKTDAA